MKISSFLSVIERFWRRANMFFASQEFATEVKRLSREVRMALIKQLGISNYQNDEDLPAEADMGDEAIQALETLCRYLDSKDTGVDYLGIAGFQQMEAAT